MERFRFRVEGIYDYRTFAFLKKLGVDSFQFDFRPLSPNFFQQYRFIELLKLGATHNHKYYLHFQDEKEFVINKILDDLEELTLHKDDFSHRFILEFSDQNNLSFYEQFNQDFILHYIPGRPREVYSSNLLKGIVLDQILVESYIESGKSKSFFHNFFEIIRGRIGDPEFELMLRLTPGERYVDYLIKNLDYDVISLPISDKNEICFRNVDLTKLESQLYLLKSNK